VPRLLLISNSTCHGEGYLEHCMEAMLEILDGSRRLLFVPFALADHAGYGSRVARALAPRGVEVTTLGAERDGRVRIADAEAVFVGGGNTFRLLATLQRSDLIGPLGERVAAGAVYIGSSAGTNLAAPTIRTTNDMPIVEPASLAALGLVPFQINCHYFDADPSSTHMGETRRQRLEEYLEENATPVVALREGAWIRVGPRGARLGGRGGALLFRRGADPEERAPGAVLDDLL